MSNTCPQTKNPDFIGIFLSLITTFFLPTSRIGNASPPSQTMRNKLHATVTDRRPDTQQTQKPPERGADETTANDQPRAQKCQNSNDTNCRPVPAQHASRHSSMSSTLRSHALLTQKSCRPLPIKSNCFPYFSSFLISIFKLFYLSLHGKNTLTDGSNISI